jgi:hypothetical protein
MIEDVVRVQLSNDTIVSAENGDTYEVKADTFILVDASELERV